MVAALLLGFSASPSHAGRLDLDVYSTGAIPPVYGPSLYRPNAGWLPGDPRYLAGESRWVQYTAHAGYGGLGLAGLIGCAAAGAAAPAVGFGLVTAVQLWQAWQLHRNPDPR